MVSEPEMAKPYDDTSGITLNTESFQNISITSHKLNGNNFLQWSQSVKLFICGHGKFGYLSGTTTKPAEEDEESERWEAENSMIMSWLINSIDPSVGRTYLFLPIAHDIWNAVNETYSDLGNVGQWFELKTQLWRLKQGEKTVTQYYTDLKTLWQEVDMFSDYEWSCAKDRALFHKMVEKERVFEFLVGLNKELDEVRGRILGSEPLPSTREVFFEVRREESRRTVMLWRPLTKSHRVFCLSHHVVTIVGTTEIDQFASTATSRDSMPHLKMLLKIRNLPQNPQKGTYPTAFISSSKSNPWIIDSGATNHMTDSSSIFSSYFPLSGNLKDPCSGKMIGNAKEVDGLYHLVTENPSDKQVQKPRCFTTLSCENAIMLWHYRISQPINSQPRETQVETDMEPELCAYSRRMTRPSNVPPASKVCQPLDSTMVQGTTMIPEHINAYF
ncbi:homogentisate phytyltransferase 1 [Hibiscus syriacus]|uniref:Homogentisate phytyltransferase 1 n=1 Tax=Hibiscus syriacus TaxID=106335 RepID=A0A6A3CUT2_HIBSY|nr:homogentisate phytyltransferase 1 [Hibiscus syriacus]